MTVLPKKDVVIVGFGAAGGPIAVELARGGLSVVALERGPHLKTDPDFAKGLDTLRYRTRGELVPAFDDLPLTFRTNPSLPAVPAEHQMASMVGGASVTWSGYAWRYYEDDFRLKSALKERYGATDWLAYLKEDGAAIEDWPLSYTELEPYYEKAEYVMGVGGWPGNLRGQIRPVHPTEGNPFEAPRQNDYPFRPLRDNATSLTFRQGALNLGLHPFHTPVAINSIPYTSPYGITRPGCTYCGFCSGHACWNGAKSSTLVAILPAAEATGHFELRPNCHVLKINRLGDRATSVEYIDATGAHRVQPGTVFILAAFTFQNVRLLLASGITGRGYVGKYFINRCGPSLRADFRDRRLNGYSGPSAQSQGIDDYNGENAAEEKLRLPKKEFFIRGGLLYTIGEQHPLSAYANLPPGVPRWGVAYKEYLRDSFQSSMAVYVPGEALPYEGSYIDLDPVHTDKHGVPAARVQRQAQQNEIRMARFLYKRGIQVLQASGAARVWGSDTARPVASMTHDCGGCRMGSTPERSVTNMYGQSWDVPNVLVGGGAVFPTISGHNPTETIWALSFRMADAILQGRIDLTNAKQFR
jgi:gluconate 2-dehydrogenase alpha chain